MAEVHVDAPGEVKWFKRTGPRPVLGPCPHTECRHQGQSVIAWGPSEDRYELVACGDLDPSMDAPDDCASHCRAWTNGAGQVVTPWLEVDRRRNPHCPNCGDLRGGPMGHETSECRHRP